MPNSRVSSFLFQRLRVSPACCLMQARVPDSADQFRQALSNPTRRTQPVKYIIIATCYHLHNLYSNASKDRISEEFMMVFKIQFITEIVG